MNDNNTITFILLIIIVLYIIYIFSPEIFPNCIWKYKIVRRFNRFNSSILEKYAGINLTRNQLVDYYRKKSTTLSLDTNKKFKNIIGFHYVDWCPHCKDMKPIWNYVKEKLSTQENDDILMFENNEEQNPTLGIDSFPTIIKYSNDNITKYTGEKNKEQLIEFVTN